MSYRRVRVLCVDDHELLVMGLQARLEVEHDMELVGHLPDATDLEQEVASHRPDVVLLDVEMPGIDPFEAARSVTRRFPRTRIVVLSAHIRDRYLSAAIDAGCLGYFSKSDDIGELIDGIRRVSEGKFVLGTKVADRSRPLAGGVRPRSPELEHPIARVESLSRREQEVLRLIGRGLSRVDIAHSLHRSPKTIDGHRDRIMKKLGLHSTTDLVRFAISEGFAEV